MGFFKVVPLPLPSCLIATTTFSSPHLPIPSEPSHHALFMALGCVRCPKSAEGQDVVIMRGTQIREKKERSLLSVPSCPSQQATLWWRSAVALTLFLSRKLSRSWNPSLCRWYCLWEGPALTLNKGPLSLRRMREFSFHCLLSLEVR